MTNREAISLVRKGINESSADSTYTNKFIYSKLLEHGKWLLVREARSGKLYKGTSIFQTARCIPVIKVTGDICCSVNTCCPLYRTRNKIEPIWEDINGPITKYITSIDNSTYFVYTSIKDWERKQNNPYNKKNTEKYVIFDEGYFWFFEKAPKKINIQAFFIKDITGKYGCDTKSTSCVRFLDQKFSIPDYICAELTSKVIEQLAGVTKKEQEDTNINKNPNRVN